MRGEHAFFDIFRARGYTEDMNGIDIEIIRSSCGTRPLYPSAVEVTGSTNDDLKVALLRGAKDGTVLFANRQTRGRGREGKNFLSPSGLYMSVILPLRADSAPYLTHVAAIAATIAIRDVTGEDARIKWVNDVYVRGKKVCGILCESVALPEGRRVIAGIGVNVDTPKESFSPELKEIAGTVSCDRTALAAAILKNLFDRIDDFSEISVKKEYRDLSLILGEEVDVIKGNRIKNALALDLTENLGLRVRYEDGSIEDLISGEVSLKLRRVSR